MKSLVLITYAAIALAFVSCEDRTPSTTSSAADKKRIAELEAEVKQLKGAKPPGQTTYQTPQGLTQQQRTSPTPAAVTRSFGYAELRDECKANGAAFQRRYRGSRIEIRVQVLQNDGDSVMLGDFGFVIYCDTRSASANELDLLRKGNSVTVTGTVGNITENTMQLGAVQFK